MGQIVRAAVRITALVCVRPGNTEAHAPIGVSEELPSWAGHGKRGRWEKQMPIRGLFQSSGERCEDGKKR